MRSVSVRGPYNNIGAVQIGESQGDGQVIRIYIYIGIYIHVYIYVHLYISVKRWSSSLNTKNHLIVRS